MAMAGTKSRKEEIIDEIAKLGIELLKLEERPAEPQGESPTVSFNIQYAPPHQPRHPYAARKSNGRWYCTGTLGPYACTWNELLDWIESNNVGGLLASGLSVYTSSQYLVGPR